MKLVQVTFQFQFKKDVQAILDDLELEQWVMVERAEGHDADGRHDNSQAFPGYSTWLQVVLPDDRVDALMDRLAAFREERAPRRHLRAYVVSVDRSLDDEG